MLIAMLLYKDIQHISILIDSTPKIMQFAVDLDKHLIFLARGVSLGLSLGDGDVVLLQGRVVRLNFSSEAGALTRHFSRSAASLRLSSIHSSDGPEATFHERVCQLFRRRMTTPMLENWADIRGIQLIGHVNRTSTQIHTQVSLKKLRQAESMSYPAKLFRA